MQNYFSKYLHQFSLTSIVWEFSHSDHLASSPILPVWWTRKDISLITNEFAFILYIIYYILYIIYYILYIYFIFILSGQWGLYFFEFTLYITPSYLTFLSWFLEILQIIGLLNLFFFFESLLNVCIVSIFSKSLAYLSRSFV